jgi:hypothetical protein
MPAQLFRLRNSSPYRPDGTLVDKYLAARTVRLGRAGLRLPALERDQLVQLRLVQLRDVLQVQAQLFQLLFLLAVHLEQGVVLLLDALQTNN